MPKFKVLIEQTRSGWVEVEAEDDEEAKREAIYECDTACWFDEDEEATEVELLEEEEEVD